MLLIILFVALFILGVIGLAWWHVSLADDGWLPLLAFLLAVGLIGGLVAGSLAIATQVAKEVNYQDAVHEREALVYRLEHREANLVGNEMLYSEIVEFNNDLRREKKWANNPWVGCFYNDLIADLDYIKFKDSALSSYGSHRAAMVTSASSDTTF